MGTVLVNMRTEQFTRAIGKKIRDMVLDRCPM